MPKFDEFDSRLRFKYILNKVQIALPSQTIKKRSLMSEFDSRLCFRYIFDNGMP